MSQEGSKWRHKRGSNRTPAPLFELLQLPTKRPTRPNGGKDAMATPRRATLGIGLLLATTLVLTIAPAGAALAATCGGLPSTMEGTSGDDWLIGGTGIDVIAGLGGNDTIDGQGNRDYMCGGTGDDTVADFNADNRMWGDGGGDFLWGSDSSSGELFYGGDGADDVLANAGNDTIDGGPNNDILDGYSGADTVMGGGGDDGLWDGAGFDTMQGGAGYDTGADCDDAGDSWSGVENISAENSSYCH
jgi:Ca2+-binding RTX toxin-like protein